MFKKKLEFRGISLNHLENYLEELDGLKLTDSFPIRFEGNGWSATLLSEQEISFTAIFKVNAVFIEFEAQSQECLDRLIKNYRYKTTRIGG